MAWYMALGGLGRGNRFLLPGIPYRLLGAATSRDATNDRAHNHTCKNAVAERGQRQHRHSILPGIAPVQQGTRAGPQGRKDQRRQDERAESVGTAHDTPPRPPSIGAILLPILPTFGRSVKSPIHAEFFVYFVALGCSHRCQRTGALGCEVSATHLLPSSG